MIKSKQVARLVMMFGWQQILAKPGAASGDMRMSDDKSDGQGGDAAPYNGRRQTDRRKSQKPFAGPDRRKGDRRSGDDRRATPRTEDLGAPDE